MTGIFAFAGCGFPTERLLPDRYYEVTGGDRQVALYRATGARWMRRVVVASFALFANRVGNFYPVVIQRQHRLRIQRIRLRSRSPG